MNQPTPPASVSPPWFLIIGLLAGIAFVGYIVWDSAGGKTNGSGNVISLNEANWQKEVVESDVPVVVDFTAAWCPPCQAFAPTVEKIAKDFKGKVKVAKFDVGDRSFSKGRKLAERYGIDSIPRTLVFKGGDEPRREFRGVTSEAELAKAIADVLASR